MITSPRAASALIATLSCLSVVFDSAPAFGAMQLNQVVSGLTNPLFVGHAGDNSNRLFIVERVGVIKVLQPGSSTPTIFLNITTKVRSGGERGLAGLAFHPLYENNGRFFVFYTRESTVTADVGDIVIAEYGVSAANENVADTTETVLLTIEHTEFTTHNGGMMAFDFDGYLRIGVGDGGSSGEPVNNAQVTGTLLGKILRIDVDVPPPALYSSPPSNPYVGVPGRDEIFSIGWRNPWRWSFDRQTGQQWVADVGQDEREEVDTPIVNGGNYGWRVFEGIACNIYPGLDQSLCVPQNFLFPIFDYTHSGERCSIIGGYVYRGSQSTLPLGTYVYGDLCTGEIFTWNGTSQTVALDTTLKISSFGEDEQGELYVVDINSSSGTVSKIVLAGTPAATPTRTQTPTRTPTPSITPTPSTTPTLGPHPLDADGNQSTNALEDGLLVVRYLFGFHGAQLTTGVVGQGCTRCDAGSILSYLSWLGSILDVDANGVRDPLTDGVLVARYLFGFRGATLVSGAVGEGCSRCTAGAIESYLSDQV